MKYKLHIKWMMSFLLLSVILSSCGLMFALFYKDWRSETAYKSPKKKGVYYQIKGVTQSHCGCSDLLAEGYDRSNMTFRIYYGGGLFAPAKYVYRRDENGYVYDTLRYRLVTHAYPDIPFDALDKEILGKMDTLARTRPAGAGMIYAVKINTYTGFTKMLREEY
ncbi:MAG: hypothetical protein IPP93_11415 [Chitinophagaceae bacterium]|nr:hypothetical protein [Chitinophagaceae bacterium]